LAGALILDGPGTGAANSRAMGSSPTPVSFHNEAKIKDFQEFSKLFY